MKPIVAIVGRPNVGKSTLVNRLAGKKVSIVKDTPGVTRDRIYAESEWLGRSYTLIDTGGIEPKTDDQLLQYMREQALTAIDTADVIIFVTDGRTGLTDADLEVGNMLRRSKKPVVIAVNKLDNMRDVSAIYEFYELGLGDPYPISAANRTGIGDLLDETLADFKDQRKKEAVRSFTIFGSQRLLQEWINQDEHISPEEEAALILEIGRQVCADSQGAEET